MAKLLKLRRGTTSQHNTFTGAEGEVTIDTTKDTAVVHDGSQAGGRPLAREDMSNVSSSSIAGRLGADSIATTKIAAGALPTDVTIQRANITSSSIMNSEVHASAAIAGTKISPNFGSQNVVTTGTIASSDITIQNSNPAIFLLDTNNNDDFSLRGSSGMFRIRSETDAADRLVVNSDGHVDIGGNLDVGAGIDVTGDITVSGTVDGRDVAADGSKLDGIESGATGDQTAAEILTAIKTVDGSGSGLDADTLDGAQPSTSASNSTIVQRNSNGYIFSNYINTTDNSVTNNTISGIICKQTGQGDYHRTANASAVRSFINVENGATADQTASEILTAIKTVDGAGSGLDADTVDGISSASFLRSDTGDTASGDITFSGGAGAVTISSGSDIRGSHGNWTGEANKIQWHSNHLYMSTDTNFYFRGTNGTTRLTVDSSGNLTAAGNVTAYSDARLKTDISTINDALGICGKLRGVSYKWLKDGSAGIGVIAQEVEEVIPEVVLTKVNTDPATGTEVEVKSVDYGKIVGVLINAINELKEEVEELKNAKITG